jgi:hypothetical protein
LEVTSTVKSPVDKRGVKKEYQKIKPVSTKLRKTGAITNKTALETAMLHVRRLCP